MTLFPSILVGMIIGTVFFCLVLFPLFKLVVLLVSPDLYTRWFL
jgi:hypothetical protein